MKDVRQCSISSVAFTLEIDAYDTLYNYFESIRARYIDNPDGEEILADIEARVAELILSVHTADRVVAKPLVDNIIGQLGSVDDICADEGSQQEQSHEEQPKQKGRRHLYRNVDDAPIGGVCSGIAAYVGCNVGIVRMIALLLLLLGGASIWVYIILWIVMPAAVTARQKLEMRGEPVTISSIKDYYNTVANSEQSKSVISSVMTAIGRIIMILFKIVMVCLLIALIFAFIAVAIAAFLVVIYSGDFDFVWGQLAISMMALTSVGLLLGLGIYASFQILNSRPIKASTVVITLAAWIILSLSTATVVAINHNGIRETSTELREMMRSGAFAIGPEDFEIIMDLDVD